LIIQIQYGNLSSSTYSQLKIQIVSEKTENKEKLEELNQKISNISSIFNTELNNQITTTKKLLKKLKVVYLTI
jgi:ferredoxin-fold anticodon binding domain-containing protein